MVRISIRYFFVVPITWLGLACAGFIAALWVSGSRAHDGTGQALGVREAPDTLHQLLGLFQEDDPNDNPSNSVFYP